MTLQQIADDVATTLGFTHDDALLNRTALLYNCQIAANKIIRESINEAYKKDIRQAQEVLETFIVDVTINQAGSGIEWDCMYFDLPRELYDLPYGGGLAWVRYHRTGLPDNCPPQLARTVFSHTTLGSLSGLYGMVYEAPCDTRPYVARDRDRVYLFGVQPQVTRVHVGLYCALPDLADTTDAQAAQDIPIPPEKLMALKRLVVDASRFSLQLPERLRNDGRDLDQPLRTERQISLNDPLQLELNL